MLDWNSLRRVIVVTVLLGWVAGAGTGEIAAAGSGTGDERGPGEQKKKFLFNEQVVVTAVIAAKELKHCSDALLILGKNELQLLPASNALAALGGMPGRNVSVGLRRQK